MQIALTEQQKEDQAAFRIFVDREVIPYADQYDWEERIPLELVKKVAQQGYLSMLTPQTYAGAGKDMLTYGLLNEEMGRGCSSVRSLLTVHTMVAQAILRWGNKQQKNTWLPKLARGESIAAFALTELEAGSDAKNIETTATYTNDTYVLNGYKKWITFGQIADLFLVFALHQGKPTAFLIEKDNPGLTIVPITGVLGTRASLLAELRLDKCSISCENLLGRTGLGISYIASSALNYGRYSVAWGCVGLAQACLDACIEYTNGRKQFGAYLKDHHLIRQMITEMITNIHAARLLCYRAGYLNTLGDPGALAETSIAKYFSSIIAMKAASDAVQIHGANGCSKDYPVQRYFRDAKIMEIIEGSTQMQQINIAEYAYQEHVARIGEMKNEHFRTE